jgi:GxxExxY protein
MKEKSLLLFRTRKTILAHLFKADFVVFDKIILEVKSKSGITDEDYARTINYLKMFRL